MKKTICVFLAVLLLCCSLPAYAAAEGHIKVAEKTLFEFDGDDNAYLYARVENDGDAEIALDSGKLVAFSADDDILLSEDYITSSPSHIILAPGQSVYISEFFWDSALEDDDVADYKFSVGGDDYGYEFEEIPAEAEVQLNGDFDNYIYVTLTNDTEEIWDNTYITAVLRDQEGTLIFVDGGYHDNVLIHPGSTVTFRTYVDSDMLKYYAAHGIKVASAEAVAYQGLD